MIYLHLGLHKTATTSLQNSVFPFIEGVNYIGRYNELGIEQTIFYQKLCDYCFSNRNSLVEENTLKDIIPKHKDLLISEEWFTADYSAQYGFEGAKWQTKIEKLARVFKGNNVKVLITLRNPADILKSQYDEFLHVDIDNHYKDIQEYLYHSNDILALDMQTVSDIVESNFGTKPTFLPFNSYNDQSYKIILSDYFGIKTTLINNISRENSKKYIGDKKIIRRRTSFQIFVSKCIPRFIKDIISKYPKLLRTLVKATFRKQYISPLTEEEKRAIRSHLYKEIERYKSFEKSHTFIK